METAVWGSMLEQFTATGMTNQMEYLLQNSDCVLARYYDRK